MVHIAFNVLGTILFMIVMELIKGFGGFPDLWQSTVNSGGIANFQTLFNLITAVVLVPFAGYLVKLSMAIVKPDVVNEEDKAYLPVPDAKLYEVPKLALSEAKKAIARMGEVAFKNLKRSCMLLEVFDERRVSVINENEDNMDVFTDSMDTYLVDLSKHVETDTDSQRITTLMQTSTNFERIGDHAINIMEVAQSVNEGKLEFSQSANEEFEVVKDAVFEITTMAIAAFAHMDSDIARRIEPLEEVIDDMVLNLKDRHIERLKRGECTTANGMAFVEALTNLERIADQCSNVALLVLSESDKAILGNHHAYVRELHKGGDEIYNEEVAKRKKQYLSRLEQ